MLVTVGVVLDLPFLLRSEFLKGRDLDLIHPGIPWSRLVDPVWGSQGSEKGIKWLFSYFCIVKTSA